MDWRSRPCDIWPHGVNGNGYGTRRVGGKVQYVHRLAWIDVHGPIPDGLCVLHRCDVRRCREPLHLFLGTRAENNADMVAKNRQVHPVGEAHPKARLTEVDVQEIRRLYGMGGWTYHKLGSRYGVSFGQIGQIVRKRQWRNIDD